MVQRTPPHSAIAPEKDCPLCPRLVTFRRGNRRTEPGWHNGAVPAFGPISARLLVVGLAPGLRGANRTGRPFTGDYAGDLLYAGLLHYGFARGDYRALPNDGLTPVDCRITNAVRCVPPANKPLPEESRRCRPFLAAEIATMAARRLKIVLALGTVAHGQVLGALDLKPQCWRFAHGAEYPLPGGLILADSYHCSRYNTNTGRLTPSMFHSVLEKIRARIDASA